MNITATGSGKSCRLRVLLPDGDCAVGSVSVNGDILSEYETEKIENSLYCVFDINQSKPSVISVRYL